MKTFLRFTLILVLLIGIAVLFGTYFLHRGKPKTEGEIHLKCFTDRVDVYFDDFGIPHIYANNAADAYRAFGYVHGQDRLFQMELMRRVGYGRLAEALGPELAATDAFFRTIGTNRAALRDLEGFDVLPAEIQTLVKAYLEGVNAFIDEGRLPIEFTLAGINPEHFTPVDVYAIAGYMAYSFAYALRTDPIVEYMRVHLDSIYQHDFDLAYAKNEPLLAPELSSVKVLNKGYALLDALPVPVLQGSNAWAIAPSRSASGKAMLANDTHIKYGSPSVWYEAHINFPDFELYGNFIAGIPLAMIGHTRSHAWGITMFEDDDSDFFIHQFANDDSTATRFGESQTRPVTKYQERIAVKGAPDTVITVYETFNGPLINAFLAGEHADPVAMYWNYTHIDNTLFEAFYGMNHATDMDNFAASAALCGSPGLNITYADSSGNIATWACSKLIKRAAHTPGKAFLRGYATEDAYRGFYDFSENPQIANPVAGFIVSANQYHDATEGMAYPGYYAPNNRYERIKQLISEKDQADMNDMKRWITDVTSPAEAAVAKELCEAVTQAGADFSEREKEVISMLSYWNGAHGLTDLPPTVHYLWLYEVLKAAMRDELGEEHFEGMLSTHLLFRTYPQLIANADSPWWDDVHTTDRIERRSEIVLNAFRKSMAKLEESLGPNLKDWRWERVHSVEHEHPLSSVKVLKPYFNVGPFPAPGGHETVNNSRFQFNGELRNHATIGPAMRIILDFKNIDEGLSILPTGNSGNVMSPHYDDQAEMYIKGAFRPMMMREDSIKAKFNKLTLSF